MKWQKGKSLAYLKGRIKSLLLICGINGQCLGTRNCPEKRGFARVKKGSICSLDIHIQASGENHACNDVSTEVRQTNNFPPRLAGYDGQLTVRQFRVIPTLYGSEGRWYRLKFHQRLVKALSKLCLTSKQ